MPQCGELVLRTLRNGHASLEQIVTLNCMRCEAYLWALCGLAVSFCIASIYNWAQPCRTTVWQRLQFLFPVGTSDLPTALAASNFHAFAELCFVERHPVIFRGYIWPSVLFAARIMIIAARITHCLDIFICTKAAFMITLFTVGRRCMLTKKLAWHAHLERDLHHWLSVFTCKIHRHA